MSKPLRVAIVAGEASGDYLGAGLIHSLQKHYTDIDVVGIGGPLMQQSGCRSLFSMETLSVMGIVEPLARLPQLWRVYRDLVKHLLAYQPDVFIGIDSPEFNLLVEKKLKRAGIPTVHYTSPSVWAWRGWRVRKIAKCVNLMLTLFPFEEAFYRKHNVPVHFVGHPLADKIPLSPDKQAARKHLGLADNAKILAMLPGSRRMEINKLAPTFLATAKWCFERDESLHFVIPAVNHLSYQALQQYVATEAPNLPITIVQQQSREVMCAADVVLLASGTATLEAMLLKRPMVVAYKLADLTYQIVKRLVTVPFVALPNLLCNQPIVPEFIQSAVKAEILGQAVLDYFHHPEQSASLQTAFTETHIALRRDASEQAAQAIQQLLQRNKLA